MLNISAERRVKGSFLRSGRGHRLRIAVTGFGPFPGVPFNASGHLIRELAGMRLRTVPAPQLTVAALPTDWRQAVAGLRALARAVRPDVLVHFGVSPAARGFVIETRAFNQTCARPDCTGALPAARCVRGAASDVLKATLPAARLLQRLRMAGIPAALSGDAGRYLCNAVLFESLALAEASPGGALAGFIHIPPLAAPEHGETLANGFGWSVLRRGAAIIIEELARAA